MDRKAKNRTLINIAAMVLVSAIIIVALYALLDYTNLSSDMKSWMLSLIVVVFGTIITIIISKVINEYVKVNGIKQEADTISTLFSIVSYTIIAIIALYLVHVNVTGLLISAGFLGIVLGLAAQSTLGNIFSGISMIVAKPFEPGDYITVQTWQYNKIPSTYPHEEFIPGYSGTVSKIGLLYTEIIGDSHTPLYVPNGVLNQALIINHHRAIGRTLHIKMELSRSASFESVKKVIMQQLKKYNASKGSSITIEHLTDSTYGIALIANVQGSKITPEKLKSEILNNIIKHAASQKKLSNKE